MHVHMRTCQGGAFVFVNQAFSLAMRCVFEFCCCVILFVLQWDLAFFISGSAHEYRISLETFFHVHVQKLENVFADLAL